MAAPRALQRLDRIDGTRAGGGGGRDDRGIVGGAKDGEFTGEPVDLWCVCVSRVDCRGIPGLRLTTASCSFSSCECMSLAVTGRGSRWGPGP